MERARLGPSPSRDPVAVIPAVIPPGATRSVRSALAGRRPRVPALATTAFHPLDGARHVRALGQERLARLVADHSSPRWEAEALGLAGELATFPREDSA